MCINSDLFPANQESIDNVLWSSSYHGFIGWFWLTCPIDCLAGIIACTTSSLLLLYWGMWDRASAKKFLPAGIYFRSKLNLWKYCAQQTCLGDSFLGVRKATRFLWSVHTSNSFPAPSSRCRQVRRAQCTTKASFSNMAQPLSMGVNFLDVYAQGCNPSWLFLYNRTTPMAASLVSACTIKGLVGSGCFETGSHAKSSFSLWNAFWHSSIHLLVALVLVLPQWAYSIGD